MPQLLAGHICVVSLFESLSPIIDDSLFWLLDLIFTEIASTKNVVKFMKKSTHLKDLNIKNSKSVNIGRNKMKNIDLENEQNIESLT